jgi:hypothetical protein
MIQDGTIALVDCEDGLAGATPFEELRSHARRDVWQFQPNPKMLEKLYGGQKTTDAGGTILNPMSFLVKGSYEVDRRVACLHVEVSKRLAMVQAVVYFQSKALFRSERSFPVPEQGCMGIIACGSDSIA